MFQTAGPRHRQHPPVSSCCHPALCTRTERQSPWCQRSREITADGDQPPGNKWPGCSICSKRGPAFCSQEPVTCALSSEEPTLATQESFPQLQTFHFFSNSCSGKSGNLIHCRAVRIIYKRPRARTVSSECELVRQISIVASTKCKASKV